MATELYRLRKFTAHAKIFKVIDADKDGKVTPTEAEMFFRGGSPTSAR